MQPLIFISEFDGSNISEVITSLSDYVVYDAFMPDNRDLLQSMKVPRLPYVIDKEIVLLTAPPFMVGEVALQFSCKDYMGNTADNTVFNVNIDGEFKEINSNNGLLQVNLTKSEPGDINLEIWAEGYIPYAGKIKIETEYRELTLDEASLPSGADVQWLPKGVAVATSEVVTE